MPTGWRYWSITAARSWSSTRQDPDGAGVLDVLPADDAGLPQVDPVGPDVPDHAVVDQLGLEHRPGLDQVVQRPVARPRGIDAGPAHGSETAASRGRSTSTSRLSRCRSTAAATSPANSGWARFGRDRSSGWAWVET